MSTNSRATDLFRSIPTGTVGIVAICCFLYLVQLLVDFPLHKVTLCPRLVLYLHEYYRIITSALFHGSIMHIAMNMMSTVGLSSMLEKRSGTLYHLLATGVAMFATSIVYISMANAASWTGHDSLMYQHSIGFSGVLFHMVVLESNLGGHTSRSVFGFFAVPAFVYPWVL